MKITKRLEQIIADGAEIYFPSIPESLPLDTAAIVGEGILFYCFPYPDPFQWEHNIRFDGVEDDGFYLRFLLQGEVEATISAVEDPEQKQMLEKWRTEGHLPSAHLGHIQHLRNWNNYKEKEN